MRKRHMEWYAGAAAAHDPDRGEVVVGEPSGWFDIEQDNLRAAMAMALATDPTTAQQLATSCWRFWVNRGLISEGARWLTLALNAARTAPRCGLAHWPPWPSCTSAKPMPLS